MNVTECNQKIERKTMSSLFFVLLFLLLTSATRIFSSHKYSRDDFPPDFIFGSATSAYQVEGAANEEGRTPSIWDTFAHSGDDHRSDEDISCDQYHKYKEDVQLMVHTGLDAYRFSISWSRLIPNGRGPVNPKGLEYYNNLINELTSHGIQPHVTLHHYDLPQALEDEYGGWVSRRIVKDFTSYANACFREFGDRVRHWTTMNEANIFIQGGYDEGWTPPKRCSPPFGFNCSKGNSSTEPYMAGHNLLLAHASAAHLYKKKYQDKQHGFIGINLFAYWLVPLTNTIKDVIATQRANDFYLGWFMEPLMFGDYPKIMKKNAGSRIPAFTSNESELVKGSFDFIGVNHYTSIHIKDNPNSLKMDQRHYGGDMAVEMIFEQDDPPTFGFPIKPEGMRGVLEYFKQAYGNPPIYIHENGQRTPRSASLDDTPRVEFIKAYIGGVLDAVRNGSNTRGYFAWSFLDVFELLGGFDESFGLYYVDLDDPDLKRYPKLSAQWYSDFLKRRSVSSSSDEVIQLNKNFSALPRAH